MYWDWGFIVIFEILVVKLCLVWYRCLLNICKMDDGFKYFIYILNKNLVNSDNNKY